MINVITLPSRTEQAISELVDQGVSFKIWHGVIIQGLPFKGISLAHKQIVQDAKNRQLNRVVIAEDDIKFTAPGAYNYFVSKIPEDYDIFLGMIYEGNTDENNKIVDYWCGMTLYCVHQRFYDQFLATREMNHIDRELSKTCQQHKFIVCDKYVAYQRDGYSFNKRKACSYGHLLKGKSLFGG